ncbi:hypothetical protein BH09BAC5_BH09BAC5_22700 [soil metagenome]
MKGAFLLFFIFIFSSVKGNVAGGELSYQCISPSTIKFSVSLTGQNFSPNDTFSISFGDNTSSTFDLLSAVSNIQLGPNYSEVKWEIIHNYPGNGSYSISILSDKREPGISNIPVSENTILSLFANVTIDPTIGCNSSPVCTNSNLIELLSVSTNFISNVSAYDPDGDSLSYILLPCSDSGGYITGYSFPNIIGGGLFMVDAITGDYFWNAPQTQGKYNFLLEIDQWHIFSNNTRVLIGSTTREIQLFVGTLSGIGETNSIGFSCFPNPLSTGNALNIQFSKSGIYFIQLMDSQGKIVTEDISFEQINQIREFEDLAPGIYFLRIIDSDNLITTEKIIVK